MSDTLERFRNVERLPLKELFKAPRNYVREIDYTALLAFAEEQQQKLDAIPIIVKDRDDYRRKVEEQQKEIGTLHLLEIKQFQRAESAEAKLSAMEEVVEALTRLAEESIAHKIGTKHIDLCGICLNHGLPIIHKPTCPVGIVLSFTKNREAGR